MKRHVLDRPAYEALRTRQSMFAEADGKALRYDPEVGPFIAAPDGDDESLAAITRLVPADRPAVNLQRTRDRTPPGTTIEMMADGVQMVARSLNDPGHE